MKVGTPVASGPSSDFSALICMTIRPSGLVRGITCKQNAHVLKRNLVLNAKFVCCDEVTYGTRAPTCTKPAGYRAFAPWGRLRTCKRLDCCKARISKLTESLLAESNEAANKTGAVATGPRRSW